MNKKIRYTFYSILASVAILPLLSSSFAADATEPRILACIDPAIKIVDLRSVANKAKNPAITAKNLSLYFNEAKVTKALKDTTCFDLGVISNMDKKAKLDINFDYTNDAGQAATRKILSIPVMSDEFGKTTTTKIENTKYNVTVKWSVLEVEPVGTDKVKGIEGRAVTIQELYLEDN